MSENVTHFELGNDPGVIVFHTKAGEIPCLITEDEEYFYFQMPSGQEDRRALKENFLP